MSEREIVRMRRSVCKPDGTCASVGGVSISVIERVRARGSESVKV